MIIIIIISLLTSTQNKQYRLYKFMEIYILIASERSLPGNLIDISYAENFRSNGGEREVPLQP